MNRDLPHRTAFPIHSRLNLAGTLILAVGLVIAAIIYVTAADDRGAALSKELADTNRYAYEIERIGGKAAVLAAKFSLWLGSLWHGKQLASTIAFLSSIIALGCFSIARLLSDDLPRDDKGNHPG